MSFYKIRDKNTGLFSPGGCDANEPSSRWKKTGKVWRGTGPLRNHLNMFLHRGIPISWEVVEYEEIEKSVKPAAELVKPETLMKRLRDEDF